MKLATLKEGGRDGTLVVVSRDLARCVKAPRVAATLRAALDDWSFASRELALISELLDKGHDNINDAAVAKFDPAACMAPLPRASQWIDGSAAGPASVLRSAADAPADTRLRIRVSDGAVGAVSIGREDGVP